MFTLAKYQVSFSAPSAINLGIVSIQLLLLKCIKLEATLFFYTAKKASDRERMKEKVTVQSDETIQRHDWSLINTSANCFDSLISRSCVAFFLCRLEKLGIVCWFAAMERRKKTSCNKSFHISRAICDKIEKLIAAFIKHF